MTDYYSNNIEHFEMVGGPCTTNPLTMSMATKQNCFPNQYPKNQSTEVELKTPQMIGGPCTANPLNMSMATKQNCFPSQYPKTPSSEIELKQTQEVKLKPTQEVRTESNPCLENPLSMSREVKSKCFPNQFPQEKESNIMMYLIVLTLLSVTSFCVWYFLMKKTE